MAGTKNPAKTEATRQKLLEASYKLFTSKNIESVSMEQAANAAGYGVATLYRYYSTKPKLAVAVATWKWGQQIDANRLNRPAPEFEGMTAAQIFSFYLESFLHLYRNDQDLLRFNQFFNVYIRAEHIEGETLTPYRELIERLKQQFHVIYEKAERDRTVRTDVPEEKMFRATLHLMLAAVTRYAVGLVYQPEGEAEAIEELKTLKRAMLREYTESSEFGVRNSELSGNE